VLRLADPVFQRDGEPVGDFQEGVHLSLRAARVPWYGTMVCLAARRTAGPALLAASRKISRSGFTCRLCRPPGDHHASQTPDA